VHALFKTLGILLAIYVVVALFKGSVYARYRAWGRTLTRAEQPTRYWSTIVIYTLLAAALVLWF
jgi:hypothetical protein